MKLNINNDIMTKDVDNPKEVSEREFWRVYLSLINIKHYILTRREIDLVSYILAEDYDRSVFRWGNMKRVAADLECKPEYLTSLKNSLLEKGVLIGNEGDLLIHPQFRAFQKYVKLNKDKETFVFTLPFKL